jgi:L-ectoine synthase
MIVKHLEDLVGTQDDIETETWTSRRFLLKKDGMGFSMHETTIKAGTETHMWYKNHLEAVYCIEGEGEIETLADGKVYPIRTGTLYALNQHDEHKLRDNKGTHMRMVCVFNPPVTGREVHDESGVYPLIEDEEPVAS